MIRFNLSILLYALLLLIHHPCRYVFAFQWPVIPILFLRAGDLKFVEDVFTGKQGCKPGRINPDDVEAYKYTFQHYSKCNR